MIEQRVVAMVPAEPGWMATFLRRSDDGRELSRLSHKVIAWVTVDMEDTSYASIPGIAPSSRRAEEVRGVIVRNGRPLILDLDSRHAEGFQGFEFRDPHPESK